MIYIYLSDGTVTDDDTWVGELEKSGGRKKGRTFYALHGHPGLLRCAANPARGCFKEIGEDCEMGCTRPS